MHRLFVVSTAQEWQAAQPDTVVMQEGTVSLPEHKLLSFIDAKGRSNGVCICGVGPVNAALAMGTILSEAKTAALVVHLGLAGSFDLDLAPLGSHWQIVKEIYAEYGLATDHCVDAQALGFPQWTDTHNVLGVQENPVTVWDSISIAHTEPFYNMNVPCIHVGKAHALTVAGVTNSRERAQRLHALYGTCDRPLLENMEGFAVALACARHGMPLLEIRTVSNLVGSRLQEHRAFGKALDAMRPLVTSLLL